MTFLHVQARLRRLGDFLSNLEGCFGRRKLGRHVAQRYVEGLLSESKRKSIQAMMGRIREPYEYQTFQHFITHSRWDATRVWRVIHRQIPERKGILLVDDTGFPKQGTHSVGVARQYSGTLGKIGNCQVAVSCTLRTETSTWPLAIDLYLPEEWAKDSSRRESVSVPRSFRFRTKWQMALEQVARAKEAGLDIECVVADAGYGESSQFREGLERMGLRYLVGVTHTGTVFPSVPKIRWPNRTLRPGRPRTRHVLEPGTPKPVSLKSLVETLPGCSFRTVVWRQGTKGPLRARFTALRVTLAHGWKYSPPRESCWLLVEKSADGATKLYVSNLPPDTTLLALARIAHSRWAIEQNYQQLKDELGLDHFEGRSWPGWHHHAVLTAIAFTFLEIERLRFPSAPLPSLPALRRLISDFIVCQIVAEQTYLRNTVLFLARSPPVN